MTIDQLIAKQEIRELVDEFSILADNRDAKGKGPLFTEDATSTNYCMATLVNDEDGAKWNRGRVGCTKMEHLTRPLFHFGTAQPRGPLWKPFLSRHGEQPSARGIMNLHYGRCDITRRKVP